MGDLVWGSTDVRGVEHAFSGERARDSARRVCVLLGDEVPEGEVRGEQRAGERGGDDELGFRVERGDDGSETRRLFHAERGESRVVETGVDEVGVVPAVSREVFVHLRATVAHQVQALRPGAGGCAAAAAGGGGGRR